MSTREQHVDEAIADYLAACDRGETPIREVFLAKYPDLADSLGAFIDDHQRMKQATPSAANDMSITVGEVGDAGDVRAKTPSPTVTVPYFGDYELVNEIARGGMGVVYRARQISLNRIVALKMILAGQLASTADVQRFRQEAESAASLDHPSILPIHEVGEYQGQQYFSMKLVEGGSLADRVAALVLEPKPSVALVQQIAAAVHYAHQRGILHRDLKPANILLDADSTPYITDFGLAKKTGVEDSGLTRTGAIVGTPSYMAPEQARGEKGLTTAADIYAVGAILYELLTGRAPFKGESIAKTLRMVEEQEPTPPQSLNPQCDPDLAAIALKCLEKQATARYETAGALAADLARWQRGEPVTARRATTLRRAIKWVQRNPVVAALSMCLMLVMVVGTVTSLVYASKAQHNERQANANATQATENATKATASAHEAKKLWYRGLYEQARSLRMAHQPGWRSQALHHLKTAADARTDIESMATADDRLPSLLDLRSEAIMALIQRDAELTRTINIIANVPVYFTANGQLVFTVDYVSRPRQVDLLVHDLTTNQAVSWLDPQSPTANDFLAHLPSIQSLNHDGTEVLVTAINKESVQIRNTRTGAIRATLTDGSKGMINRFAASRWQMSRDGQWVAGVRRHQQHAELLLWNVRQPNQPQIVAKSPYPKEDQWGAELVRSGRYFGHLHFSPDGKTLSFASEDRQSYRLFDITRLPPLAVELPAKGEILNAIWHPTQPLVATVARIGSSQQLALWNVATQQPQAIVEGDIEVTSEGKLSLLSFSHDGRFLALPAAQPTTVRVLDAFTCAERLRINDVCTFRIGHLAWQANGELATYGLMEQLKCWRLPEDQPQSVYPNLRPQRRPAFSADGRWLAVYAPTGQALPQADHRFVAYNVQSALMLDRIVVLDRQRRAVAHTLTGFRVPRVGELLFSPDGQHLSAFDQEHVLVRETTTSKEIVRRALPKTRAATNWSGTFYLADRRLVGMYEYTKKEGPRGFGLWDVQADQPLDELAKVLSAGSIAPSLLVSSDGTQAFLPAPPSFAPLKGSLPPKPASRLFDLPTGRKRHEFALESPYQQAYTMPRLLGPKTERVLSLTTDLSGTKMGMGNENFHWAIHALPSGQEIFRTPIRGFAENACSFMNGSEWIVIGGDTGHVEVWDIQRQQPLFRWQPHGGKKVEHLAADRHDIVTNSLNDDRLCVLHLDELRPRLTQLGLGWETTPAK